MVTLDEPQRLRSPLTKWLIFSICCLLSHHALAIDNPDAVDYVSLFEQKSQVHLKKMDDPKNSSKDYVVFYSDYQKFLDKELEQTYVLLKTKLSPAQQLELEKSQQLWSQYRKAEFQWIDNTWTTQAFGSSSSLSRGAYRSNVVKNRILTLLYYLNNFEY